MNPAKFFDNAATTRTDPRVVEAMLPYFTEKYGNPDSNHSWGIAANAAIEKSRRHVAALIGAEPEQIFFCGTATDALNFSLKWLHRYHGPTGVSPFEHSAVREAGYKLQCPILPNKGWDVVCYEKCQSYAVMHTCNETGAIITPPERDVPLLHDITQAVGKQPLHLNNQDRATFATFTGHKFYGPKGVAAIYVADPTMVDCNSDGWSYGGHQESFFSGTRNVAGIVGLGVAAQIAQDDMEPHRLHAEEMRKTFLETLSPLSDWYTNCAPQQSPYTLSLTIPGIASQTLLVELDMHGFAISAGSACSAKSTKPSPVLKAIGLSDEDALSTLRISFSHDNTSKTTEDLAKCIVKTTEKLRN